MNNMKILLLTASLLSSPVFGQKIPAPTENGALNTSTASVFINALGKPVICPESSPQSCTRNPTIGELHNDGAMSIFRTRADIKAYKVKYPTLTFDQLTMGQVRYISSAKALGLNAAQAQQTLMQIKEAYLAAGVIDRNGQFKKGLKPASVIEFLQKRGDFSPQFARALNKISDPSFGKAATQDLLKAEKWSGRDKRAAIVAANILKSSEDMWPYDNGASPPNEFPIGLADAIGTLLLIESGPASVIGGYMMSCAAAGSWI